VIKAKFGDRLDEGLRRLLPFLFRRRLNPDLMTVVGALICLVAAAAFSAGWFVAGGFLMLLGGAFDLLDGVVARSHGIATRFGAFLDSTLDRVVDMALLLGIAMHYVFEGEPGRVLLAGYVLATSVLVSYTQARAELVLPSFRVGLFERGERIIVLALGALSGFLVAALWIVAIGSTATVIQRFTRAHQEMSRIDASERRGLGENT
jgi:phosphatidylglycerophosphate synthase